MCPYRVPTRCALADTESGEPNATRASPIYTKQVRSLACEDGDVLRSVTLSLALSVLAAACALTEAPPPAGTRPIQSQVQNLRALPAKLTVTTPTGVLADAVQPPSLPAGSTTDVIFYIPNVGEWTIDFDGHPIVSSEDFTGTFKFGCALELTLSDGAEVSCPGP